MGLAGPLLVFTGLWHVLEWLMGGRTRDTLRLIPFGLVYLVLGYLIVTLQAGTWVLALALVITTIGASAAFIMRKTAEIRSWVIWAFIVIDLLIIAGLVAALLG